MTRDQRIDAAANVIFDRRDRDGCRDIAAIALETALADLGGLDGLTLLADLTDQSRPMEDRKAQLITTEFYERLLAAAVDRDRLRDVLREGRGGPIALMVAALVRRPGRKRGRAMTLRRRAHDRDHLATELRADTREGAS